MRKGVGGFLARIRFLAIWKVRGFAGRVVFSFLYLGWVYRCGRL